MKRISGCMSLANLTNENGDIRNWTKNTILRKQSKGEEGSGFAQNNNRWLVLINLNISNNHISFRYLQK